MAHSTVSRWLKRSAWACARASNRRSRQPLRAQRPGELVHVDVKKLGRIRGAPDAGSPATGATTDARAGALGADGWECGPRLRRRRNPTGLRRGARRRARRDRGGLLHRAVGLVQIDGDGVERVMTDNGTAYRSDRPRRGLPRARAPAPAHPGLPAAHQRQGRALHPDASGAAGPTERSTAASRGGSRRCRDGSATTVTTTSWLPRQEGARSWLSQLDDVR